MRKLYLFLFPLLLLTFYSNFLLGQYAAGSIPDSLLPGADAVIRDYRVMLEIRSESSATLDVMKAITVLRKSGEKFGQFVLGYDKFSSPGRISIALYDASGTLIKKVKASDIKDYSAYEEGTLFSDNRMKAYSPMMNSYPYTVLFEYTLDLKGYLSLPGFQPMANFGISVEKASFSVLSKQDVSYSFHELNFDKVHTSASHEISRRDWSIQSLPAFSYEPLSIDFDQVTPTVLLFPHKFEYDGSKGDFSSWGSFGRWINELLKDRRNLPEKTRILVHELTDSIQGDYAKAKKLYEYMQSKSRYISIQLGIGGYQPFSAETVDKLSYGDCKALSNYYITLLQEAGIPAIYAITTMEEGKTLFMEDIPATIYFNHVVVCIPFKNDSVWVECTSSHVPFGFMGEEVVGHPALLVIPGGGKIVKVPEWKNEVTKRSRSCIATVHADGSAKLQVNVAYYGLELGEGLGQYVMSKKEQSEYLYKDWDLNDIVIDGFNYSYSKEIPARVSLEAAITCNKYGILSGKRMLLSKNIDGSLIPVPDKVEIRKIPFELGTSINEIDSLSLLIPDGYTLESDLSPFRAENKFGNYTSTAFQSERKITLVQNLRIFKGEYPASEYSSFREFILSIQKAEKQKIFLKMNL